MMRLPKPNGAPKRIIQELAAHAALREKAVATLHEVTAEGPKRAAKARKLMDLLRPSLEAWVEKHMPPDKQMEKRARLYMKAVDALHEADHAETYARALLDEQEEQEQQDEE